MSPSIFESPLHTREIARVLVVVSSLILHPRYLGLVADRACAVRSSNQARRSGGATGTPPFMTDIDVGEKRTTNSFDGRSVTHY